MIEQIKTYSEVKQSVNLKRQKIDDAMDLLKDAGVNEDTRKKIKQESLSNVLHEMDNHTRELKDSFNTFIKN